MFVAETVLQIPGRWLRLLSRTRRTFACGTSWRRRC